MVYICNAAIKRKEILPFTITWMDLEGIKSERERQILYNFTYMWNLKQTNKQAKTELIENRGFQTTGEVWEGKMGERCQRHTIQL